MADKPATIVAAVLLSVVGVFGLLMMPLTTTALSASLGLDASQAGTVAALEVLGGALASIFAAFWIGKVNWRIAAGFAIVVVIVGNVLSAQITDLNTLMIARFATGFFGMGTAFAVAIAVISTTAQTDRNFAFSIAAQVAFSVICLLALPTVIESQGYGGLLLPLAGLGVLFLFPMKWLPEGASFDGAGMQGAEGASMAPALIALLVMLIWCTGLGAIWTFAQGVGIAGGLTAVEAGGALALSSGIAILGALLASALGDKFGRIPPVAIALVVQAGMLLLLMGEMSWFRFAATMAIFQVFWNLTGPYLMGTVALSDATGKVSVMIPAAQTGGFFLGPAIAGAFLTGDSLTAANYVAIVCILAALALFIPVALRLNRQLAAAAA